MNIIEKRKIALLKKKVELKKETAMKNGKFSLFHTKFSNDIFNNPKSYEGLKSTYEILESWEDICNLPYNVGVSLDAFVNDPNLVVMIHRANLSLDKNISGLPNSETLQDIMENGLINYGHLNAYGGSALIGVPDLALTMTSMKGLSGYINLVSSYKDNDTIIISAFPKAKYDENGKLISGLVDEDGHIVDKSKASEIYDLSKTNPQIKKEYMMGAIIKKNNGFDEFYTRDEIINSKEIETRIK